MKTVYLTSENKAILACPQCEKTQVIDAAKYLKKDGPIKIKVTFRCPRCYCGTEHAPGCDGVHCKTGHSVVFLLERRRHYRKQVNLEGKIRDENGKVSSAAILDVSKKGLLLRLYQPGRFEVGSPLTVSFVLNDPQRSQIEKEVIVRKITAPDQLGVEFACVDAYSPADKAIGFYLMN